MTNKTAFQQDLYHYGASATLVQVSGDACPCTAKTGSYSAEWHRLNPAPGDEDCSGTELINTSTTNTSILAFFYPPTALANRLILTKAEMVQIGEIEKDDLMYFGGINATSAAFVDIAGLDEKRDYITYDSNDYLARHIYKLAITTEVGQLALLKRLT